MKKFLLVLLVVFIAITAFACTVPMERADRSVVSITVNGVADLEYIAGEALDINGATIIITYSDGETETIELQEDMLSGFDMDVPEDDKVITVTYAGVTTKFTVDVLDLTFSSVQLYSEPYKKEYIEGETIVPDGATININYEGGKVVNRPVTSKMLETYDNTRLGEQSIFVSYHGYRLEFKVTFVEKTVTAVTVVREPNQHAVHLGYADRLSLEGMNIKLTYDNGLEPTVSATDIADDIKVYIDDSSAIKVVARVAYIPVGFPQNFTYPFAGNALVRRGAFVAPETELASNGILDNVKSKSYGQVQSTVDGNVVVNTIVDYEVTDTSLKVGQILLYNEFVGRLGGTNVYAAGGGGLILSVGEGKVTVQTCPVGSFNITVQNRSYSSMEIQTYPVTTKYASNIDNIMQGDTLDLSTGAVRVYFDNGENEVFPMNSSYIRVANSADDMVRREIKGLEFESVDDVTNLEVDENNPIYELQYKVKHDYGDKVSVVASVINETTGNPAYVYADQRRVSLVNATNYTVSITASMKDTDGTVKVSECSYHIATKGAATWHNKLDITAAGRHSLNIIYGGVESYSIPMMVNVIQPYPVSLNIVDTTDNITDRSFWLGSYIPLTTIKYYITYNNGDTSTPTGVTLDMLDANSSLYCDRITTVGNRKEIRLKIQGTDVEDVVLVCDVIPVPIRSVTFVREPEDTFLTAQAMNGSNDVNMNGAVISVLYENGDVEELGREETLNDLKSKGEGEKRISLTYDPADVAELSISDIYNLGAHYTGTLTYTNEYGVSGTREFAYYIINMASSANNIHVLYRAETSKLEYVQCEEWDLTDINVQVTRPNGTTDVISATLDMIYDSTTDLVGTGIPVKFRYLGKVDSTSIKIDVIPRMESKIIVTTTGKDTYFDTDASLDLRGYRFSLSYNAGADAEILGIGEFSGARNAEGWWYELLDETGGATQFARIGSKFVKLYHTSILNSGGTTVYNTVSTTFPITVYQNTTDIDYISYDLPEDLNEEERAEWMYEDTGLPILSVTAAGWELFLHEYNATTGNIEKKYITVHYKPDSENQPVPDGKVEITSDMINYNKLDESRGYRSAIITYKGHTTTVVIRVRTATLERISVERTPIQNFIVGSALSLDRGILKLEYAINENGVTGTLYKYISMDSSDVTTKGFNSNIGSGQNSVSEEITLTYKGKTVTYMVTVFNKQAINFIYQNTIFFYGNTKKATATPLQLIDEFDLPKYEFTDSGVPKYDNEIWMWYACSRDFIPEADFNGDENEYLKILTTNGDYYYVSRGDLSSAYYIEPAPRGYEYYIVMEVAGNDYYKAENYAFKKFTIIPKVIEVSTVNYTMYAFVKTYTASAGTTNAVANAVLNLYKDLDTVVSSHIQGKISSAELLSPNASSFEIGVFVTSDFDSDDSDDMDALDAVFTAVEQYIDNKGIGLNISASIRHGINVGQYNGKTPEYLSYRIASGETLTLNNVLELLSGSLALAGGYDYGVDAAYDTDLGTLFHNNYNIDFKSGKYYVTPRVLDPDQDIIYTGGSWDDENKILTIASNQEPSITVYGEGSYYRTLGADEITYYTDALHTERVAGSDLNEHNVPFVPGTYYAKVASADAFSKGGVSVQLDFILMVN